MAVFGIVAEYNPFHNGHAYQINRIKQSGEHTVVVVMSPNVVQRGDFAILSKWTRAQAALSCGADLVIELPSIFALTTAERFAYGAVKCLDALGCVDFVCFGSESGNIDNLIAAASLSDDENVKAEMKNLLSEGMTFAKARSLAVSKQNEDAALSLCKPNDILAVEYIKSLKRLNCKIKPYPILRKGVEHNSDDVTEGIASASFIRQNFDLEKIKNFVPQKAFELYESAVKNGERSNGIKELESALILKLRTMSKGQIANLHDVSEGLENRILRASKESTSFEELCEKIKTKRYTMARIRRILMYALLDFSKDIITEDISFIRVIGHNQSGLKLLSQKTSQVPIIASLAKARELGDAAKKLVEIEEKISDIYSLTLENKKNTKNEFSTPVIRM